MRNKLKRKTKQKRKKIVFRLIAPLYCKLKLIKNFSLFLPGATKLSLKCVWKKNLKRKAQEKKN
jgi:hypothetical protein